MIKVGFESLLINYIIWAISGHVWINRFYTYYSSYLLDSLQVIFVRTRIL